ncbi:S41 family peptidase [Massilia sp. Dwa41.01b]|uniref:S41 family peptidase n=1 Tax=unclassified Massilia TaxID=2609279 RepID=UPI0015FF5E75|nr:MULTISPECIES: S41 family peptidase [unclassified Massilia]QNA90773.1 S41 family peptidase [Massilia sp. Dwa41.01b]QNA98010.1 S41 family peptidase [Massilia sp. Se16.2.3]
MGNKAKNMGLVGLGLVAGVALTAQVSAWAQKGDGPLPLDELRQLADVYGLIKSDYVVPVEDKKLLSEAIGGMVASLDPHSVYLDQKAYKEMRDSVRGKFVGVGIEVASEDGYVKIVSPIEDSPAYRAGIKAGDLITRIDNVPVKGLSLDEAIKKMRGKPGSKVTLTIARRGDDRPWVVPLAREEIRVLSVKAKMVEPGYAWVRISQFQEATLEELAGKTAALYADNPEIKGLVLDLRNDPGGLLPGAIGVSSAFLPKEELIVSTKGQLPDSNKSYYGRREFYAERGGDPLAKAPAQLKTVPMVVLINGGSASASEIVAGALQDYKRAIVMGSQSFGKGSVQTLRQLSPDTAIKLTTARYYTPKGRAIQANGINPDLAVDETAEGDGLNALRVREVDLQRHLTGENEKAGAAKDARDSAEQQQRALALLKNRKPLELGGKDDFQLAQALNHFKGLPVKLAKPEAVEVTSPEAKAVPGSETKPPELKGAKK